jgi:hypothetical protein
MNVKRYLGLALFTYLVCAAFAVVNQKDTPPQTYVETPVTITLGDLTPQQLQERAVELTTTTSTSTSTSTTTSTQPTTRVAYVDPDTKCQEWFPTAISVGWPNNTETLQKLGRLLWKETRCLNLTPLSSDENARNWFNGHDWGVAQINEPVHRPYVEQVFNMPFEESMSDPTLNLRFAFLLYSELEAEGRCGWQPWSMC